MRNPASSNSKPTLTHTRVVSLLLTFDYIQPCHVVVYLLLFPLRYVCTSFSLTLSPLSHNFPNFPIQSNRFHFCCCSHSNEIFNLVMYIVWKNIWNINFDVKCWMSYCYETARMNFISRTIALFANCCVSECQWKAENLDVSHMYTIHIYTSLSLFHQTQHCLNENQFSIAQHIPTAQASEIIAN